MIPVNALVVREGAPLVLCSLHDDYVEETQAVTMHGGRGREPKVTCIPCMHHSALAWQDTECPFCMMTAHRVLSAIERYIVTGEPVTLPDVPTEELPAHRSDCRFVYDVLPGQATP